MSRACSVFIAFLSATALGATNGIADDVYAGKTINMIVGYSPGGGYDIYTRALARYMSQHIPGRPTVVVQNMPGAGSAKAASYVYSIAAPDGLTIGAVSPGVVVAPLLDPSNDIKYDPTKFIYLGSADSGTRVCISLKTSKVQSYKDAQSVDFVFGAVSAGSSTFDYAWLHRKTAGAKYRIVAGYPGTSDITLAMERGEVDGLCGLDWSSLKSQKPDWLRDKRINVLVQIGPAPSSELTSMGVPEIWPFSNDEFGRKVAELVAAQQVFGRPYVLPPATPKDRVEILRSAFFATLGDPEFLKDAARVGLNVEPTDGPTVQAAVARVFAAPKDVADAARAAIKP